MGLGLKTFRQNRFRMEVKMRGSVNAWLATLSHAHPSEMDGELLTRPATEIGPDLEEALLRAAELRAFAERHEGYRVWAKRIAQGYEAFQKN